MLTQMIYDFATNVGEVKSDIKELKSDNASFMNDVKSDMSDVKSSINELKSDNETLRHDFEKSAHALKVDVEQAIESSRNEIMVHVDDLNTRVKKVEHSVVAVPGMVDVVVKNMNEILIS